MIAYLRGEGARVFAERRGQTAALVFHGRIVVDVDVALEIRVSLDPLVERGNLRRRIEPGFQGKSNEGVMEQSTTRIPFAAARSAIEARLSSVCSGVMGPVFPAMSLVPARMTTAFGLRSITSWRKRISICGEVLPADAAVDVRLAGERTVGPLNLPSLVMESPMNTTRASPGAGDPMPGQRS